MKVTAVSETAVVSHKLSVQPESAVSLSIYTKQTPNGDIDALLYIFCPSIELIQFWLTTCESQFRVIEWITNFLLYCLIFLDFGVN